MDIGPNATDPQRTYYFRRTFEVPEAPCYFRLESQMERLYDGAAVYINGIEAYRVNLPMTPLNSSVFTTRNGGTSYNLLSGGWFKAGTNLIAVELHRFSSNLLYMSFDMALMGIREAFNCTPAPPLNRIESLDSWYPCWTLFTRLSLSLWS